MYQRYYKQRRIGRFIGFALIIGSGLSHYVRSSYKFIKENIKLEKLSKYDINIENILEKSNIIDKDINYDKKYFLYESNINNLIKNKKTNFNFKKSKEEIKLEETYYIYNKIRNKI